VVKERKKRVICFTFSVLETDTFTCQIVANMARLSNPIISLLPFSFLFENTLLKF
jgi:hypothetical protein